MIPGGTSEATSIVTKRFQTSLSVIAEAFNDAYGMIGVLIGEAQKITLKEVGFSIPVRDVAISDTPPDMDLLDIGKAGIPEDVEQAIFDMGLERSGQLLTESISNVRREWATLGWPLADGTLARMVMAEIDKYEQTRRDLNLAIAEKSMDVAADFARIIMSLVATWSQTTTGIKAQKGVDEAELRLKQAEDTINALINKARLSSQAITGAAGIASQLVSAAFVGTSASASVHEGASESDSVHSAVHVEQTESTVSAERTREEHSHTVHNEHNSVEGTDTTVTSDSNGSSSTSSSTEESSESTTSTVGSSASQGSGG